MSAPITNSLSRLYRISKDVAFTILKGGVAMCVLAFIASVFAIFFFAAFGLWGAFAAWPARVILFLLFAFIMGAE